MKSKFGPLILIALVLAPELLGQVVRPRAARTTLLENAEQAVERNREVRDRVLPATDNPFIAWVDPETLRPLPTGPAPVAPPPPQRLADRAILNLSGNRTLERGQAFDARIGNEEYRVIVEDITAQSFTLRLGEVRLTRNFGEEQMGSGRITRPSEPASGQP